MKESEAALLARAITLAAQAHEAQRDKAGAPYILHPLRMMQRAQTDREKIVAVLHDVVEDSDWTLDGLAKEGFPPDIVAAIDCLTHREGESYDDAIERVLTAPLAMRVKFYDLEDNMTLSRLSALTDRDLERVRRYHRAHQRLLEALARAV